MSAMPWAKVEFMVEADDIQAWLNAFDEDAVAEALGVDALNARAYLVFVQEKRGVTDALRETSRELRRRRTR